MRKIVILLLFLSISLIAYSDMDLDGVEDSEDKCPNTPLSDLVDLNGCTIESLISNHHFNISIGEIYTKDSDSKVYTSSVRFNYFYKDSFSLTLSSSSYNRKDNGIDSNGLNDTYLFGFYSIKPIKNLRIKSGVGISFPTYDSRGNRLDYSFSSYFTYAIDRLSIIGGAGYRVVRDRDLDGYLEHQNSFSYNIGFGYYLLDSFYSSLSYSNSNSIYKDYSDIESISIYNYFKIDKNWFLNLSYTRGLNSMAVDSSLGVRVGYYW